MLEIPAFGSDKNRHQGPTLVLLLEIEYATAQFLRIARYDVDVTFEGIVWPHNLAMGEPETSQGLQGKLPAFDLTISNIGRELQSILEFNPIEDARPGRLIWVHPDHLDDPTAKHEEKFSVIAARTSTKNAVLTCTAIPFDPLGLLIPADVVTHEEFPNLRRF